ncbi:MAG: Hsp20/alpha crystallin family protein [Syntrophobacteraceae bacterium]
MTKKDEEQTGSEKQGGVIGNIFGGLTDLIEKLGELAEKGEELSKVGNLKADEKSKGVKGVYGVSVKFGIGGQPPKVEPFGNIREDIKTGRSVVQEVREPIVDVFEEENHILVLAEMPGVEAEDVKVSVNQEILTFSAEREDRKYRKEVLIPGECSADRIRVTCKNGIVEIKCDR